MAAGFELTVTVAANRIIRCFAIVASTIRQGRAARIAQTRILRLCFISSSLLHRLVKKPRSAGSRAALHFVTASSPLAICLAADTSSTPHRLQSSGLPLQLLQLHTNAAALSPPPLRFVSTATTRHRPSSVARLDRGFGLSATDEIDHEMKADEEGEQQEGLMDRSGGVVAAKEARNGMNRSHWASSAIISSFLALSAGKG